MKQMFMKKLTVIMLSLPLLGTVATVDCAEKENQRRANAEQRHAIAHFQKVFDRQAARKRAERRKLPAIPLTDLTVWAQGVNKEVALKKQQQPNVSSSAQAVHSNSGALEPWAQRFQSDLNYPNIRKMRYVPLAKGQSSPQTSPEKAPEEIFEELSAKVTKRRKTKNDAQVPVNPAQKSLDPAVESEADEIFAALSQK